MSCSFCKDLWLSSCSQKLACISIRGLVKHRFLSPFPRLSDSVGLGRQRIWLSDKFAGDGDIAGSGMTLSKPPD